MCFDQVINANLLCFVLFVMCFIKVVSCLREADTRS